MLFHTFNNTNIQFAKSKLTWRIYTTAKTLLTTQKVELIDKKVFTKGVLNKNIEAFMVYINSLSLELKKTICLAKEVQIALLLAKKFIILGKYSDFAEVFLEKSANVLPE